MMVTWEEKVSSPHEDSLLAEHVLIVRNPDDPDLELLHPESCTVWVGTRPDSWGQQKRYECAVTAEIEAIGYDSMFPDGLSVGVWLLAPWVHRTPSTPSGPEEWDAGVEVIELWPVDEGER